MTRYCPTQPSWLHLSMKNAVMFITGIINIIIVINSNNITGNININGNNNNNVNGNNIQPFCNPLSRPHPWFSPSLL
ncbi:hypothetical protein N7454_001808 [Penicillium verhagenii]|nr:hypothetical protein N7454_001808 [Penicillium verhagenii]